MRGNRMRVVAGTLLGAATMAALAACTTSGSATVNGSTVQWKTVSAAPPTSVAKQVLMFPNTNFTAAIDGYDTPTQMIDFRVQKWVPGGPDDGHYAPDPSKPGNYRLPLAANVKILSSSTLCTPETEQPNLDGVPCTAQQLITGLENGHTGVADVHVDADDHIDSIKEDYVP